MRARVVVALLVCLVVVPATATGLMDGADAGVETPDEHSQAVVESAGGAPGQASDTGGSVLAQATTNDTPQYTSPETATREEYARTGIDVSAAVAADTQRLRGQYREHLFDRRLAAANDSAALVEETAARISDRVESLDRRHAALVEAFGDGDISTMQLLRGLLQVRTAAAREEALVAHVEDEVESTPGVALSPAVESQFVALSGEILLLPAPVTSDHERAVSEAGVEDGVYVQASETGLVLASHDERHVRQATLRSERDESGPDQFDQPGENRITVALERAESLYPSVSITSISAPFGDTTIYRAEGQHDDGEFTTYLDGATTNVFHELQYTDSEAATETATNTSAGVELTVATTQPSGPMRVSVASASEGNATGDPIAGATVRVGDEIIGTTDAGGDLRTTQPRATQRVSVTTLAGDTVSVEL